MPTTTEILKGTCECKGCPHCAGNVCCAGQRNTRNERCPDCRRAALNVKLAQPPTWPRCPYCCQSLRDHTSQARLICAECERELAITATL